MHLHAQNCNCYCILNFKLLKYSNCKRIQNSGNRNKTLNWWWHEWCRNMSKKLYCELNIQIAFKFHHKTLHHSLTSTLKSQQLPSCNPVTTSCIQGSYPFQKQISRTFPELFQDSDSFFKSSKIHINLYTPKIVMLILLTAFHTLHIFSWV